MGELRPVLGATGASVLVVPLPTGPGFVWGVLDASQFGTTALPGVDTTRGVASVDDRASAASRPISSCTVMTNPAITCGRWLLP